MAIRDTSEKEGRFGSQAATFSATEIVAHNAPSQILPSQGRKPNMEMELSIYLIYDEKVCTSKKCKSKGSASHDEL